MKCSSVEKRIAAKQSFKKIKLCVSGIHLLHFWTSVYVGSVEVQNNCKYAAINLISVNVQ